MSNQAGHIARPSSETIMILYWMVTEILNLCPFFQGHAVCVNHTPMPEHYQDRDWNDYCKWASKRVSFNVA